MVEYYTDLLRQTAADPKIQDQIRAKGMFPEFISGADYADWWRRTQEGWTEVALVAVLVRLMAGGTLAALGTGLAASVLLYALFDRLLGLPLPSGTILGGVLGG